MPKQLRSAVSGFRDNLIKYLKGSSERDEDQAISYFREVFGKTFVRRSDAQNADGYVPGHVCIELKGDQGDWYAAFFQALAYRNKGLAFTRLVVATHNFLALWDADDPSLAELRNEVLSPENRSVTPSTLGPRLARKFGEAHYKSLVRSAAKFDLDHSFLKEDKGAQLDAELTHFEQKLVNGVAAKVLITPETFEGYLKRMAAFFEKSNPMHAVRAFYALLEMWNGFQIDVKRVARSDSKYTISGQNHYGELVSDTIEGLKASSLDQFTRFINSHCIFADSGCGEDIDMFFQKYDDAIDAVAPKHRIQNGIFFTDQDLARFALWFARLQLGDIGKKHLVIDPACGSGNLVSSWRSPLEMRHKLVSDLEPDHLYIVKRRLERDRYHQERGFTVVPDPSKRVGLNFLDKTASEYLEAIRNLLADRSQDLDKPLAILVNPPFRSDDDQSADSAPYKVADSIVSEIGVDASSERYACFLEQIRQLCHVARESTIPGNSLLLLFSKSKWLTRSDVLAKVRENVLGSFEDKGAFIVDAREFFGVKGRFPVAFSLWKFVGEARARKKLDSQRAIPVYDLSWLTKSHLVTQVKWSDSSQKDVDKACEKIIDDSKTRIVEFGIARQSIMDWSGLTRQDFMRGRRKHEVGSTNASGLPKGDERHKNKKAYGEANATHIGFMDDLTPCRIARDPGPAPWSRLNLSFMDVRKTRLFSSCPTHYGYNWAPAPTKCAVWYAISRTWCQHPYPMWADSENIWAPDIPKDLEEDFFKLCFAVSLGENECIEATFPGDNPVHGAFEIRRKNPLAPLWAESFFNTTIAPRFKQPLGQSSVARPALDLFNQYRDVYNTWQSTVIRGRPKRFEPSQKRPYSISEHVVLTDDAGILQIRHWAIDQGNRQIQDKLATFDELTKKVVAVVNDLLLDEKKINYFASMDKSENVTNF